MGDSNCLGVELSELVYYVIRGPKIKTFTCYRVIKRKFFSHSFFQEQAFKSVSARELSLLRPHLAPKADLLPRASLFPLPQVGGAKERDAEVGGALDARERLCLLVNAASGRSSC